MLLQKSCGKTGVVTERSVSDNIEQLDVPRIVMTNRVVDSVSVDMLATPLA